MYKNFDPHKPYFYGVAMFIILFGSVLLALGAVELGLNLIGTSSFNQPLLKVMGGVIIIALGYIHLELELLRSHVK